MNTLTGHRYRLGNKVVRRRVDHIDTAQYYGPRVVNQLIREALSPCPENLALVSKVVARRDDFGAVLRYDDPDSLPRPPWRTVGSAVVAFVLAADSSVGRVGSHVVRRSVHDMPHG